MSPAPADSYLPLGLRSLQKLRNRDFCAARSANTRSDVSTSCSTVSGTTRPTEANASIVTSGIVLTVSRPISGST